MAVASATWIYLQHPIAQSRSDIDNTDAAAKRSTPSSRDAQSDRGGTDAASADESAALY
mgnify:CR=1 FL=1